MSDGTWAAIIFLVVFVLMVLLLFKHYSKSESMLQKWADENGYQVQRKERRYLRRGPFFWSTSRNQEVFYVEVLDRNGASRTGFVRCGGRWLGMMTEQVEARWNE